MLLPAITGDGAPLLASERSAEALTVVVAVAELLALLASVSVSVTLAVFESEPRVAGATLTVTVTVALAAALIVPRLQGRAAQAPWLEETETRVTPLGRVSETVAAEAGEPPLLATVIV